MDLVLNPKLEVMLSRKPWITPYIAYERVRQMLAPFYITIKSVHFTSDDKGVIVLPLTPRLPTPEGIEYLHFKWKRNEMNSYEVVAKISHEVKLTEADEVIVHKGGPTKSSKKPAKKEVLSRTGGQGTFFIGNYPQTYGT